MCTRLTRPFTLAFVLGLILPLLSAGERAEAGCVMKFGGPDKSVPLRSFDEIDHTELDTLLRHYVDDRGRVCYGDWAEHRGDVHRLQAYLFGLTQVDPSRASSSQAAMAYYINAYNALTLWGILDNYPVVSIQNLDGEKSRYAVFDDLQLWVGDRFLSLNGIENDALRPMGDPRIHFALVCAARGCPRLRNEAYRAEYIDGQLNDNAVEFFSDRNRFQISRLTAKVKISPILKWYREDFGHTDDQVIATVFRFLPREDQCWLAAHAGWKLAYLGYDWGLNDGCPAAKVAVGRMPYRAYSKISPLIAPLMPSADERSNAAAPTPASTPMQRSQPPMQRSQPAPLPRSEPPAPLPPVSDPDTGPPLPGAAWRQSP